jgi:energy-coupling factor transporter ATP-binding protein EcfA2
MEELHVEKPSDDDDDDDDDDDAHSRVLAYLQAIYKATRQLATSDRDDDDDDDEEMQAVDHNNDEDAANLVEQIARFLLQACHPSLLSQSIDHLPPQPIIEMWQDACVSIERDETILYQLRRVDYLRQLLRAMAVISMDVTAQVCFLVQKQLRQTTTTTTTSQERRVLITAALLLFAEWLPVAPQISFMVSDLFALKEFVSPLLQVVEEDSNHNNSNHYQQQQHQQRLLVIEAAYKLVEFYCRRREHFILINFWNWSSIFNWFSKADMQDDDDNDDDTTSSSQIRWYAVRVAARVLNLSASRRAQFYKLYSVDEEQVVWIMHPWDLDHEVFECQKLLWDGNVQFWRQAVVQCPTLLQVRAHVALHPFLVHVGNGIVFSKNHSIHNNNNTNNSMLAASQAQSESTVRRLVVTPTTATNLGLVGVAMCLHETPPILIVGRQGSGKSSLVRELARLFAGDKHAARHHHHGDDDDDDQLLEIHVDDETDTKTLVGSYTTSDIPGEFEWRPGALTIAVRTGKWVLIEDVDCVPVEIQASLLQLLEARLLPLGNGKMERCHPNFRLFGTMTSVVEKGVQSSRVKHGRMAAGKRLLHPALWKMIQIEPLPAAELKDISIGLHPNIPMSIVDAVMKIFQSVDQSGRALLVVDENDTPSGGGDMWIGRQPSVRDLFKVFSRVRHGLTFERDTQYATEAQRTLCLAEAVDVFVAASPDVETRRQFIRHVAAPAFGITADLALQYVEARCPTIVFHETCTEIGRAIMKVPRNAGQRTQSATFASTEYVLRLMEAIGVCIQESEPVLLVGETGCG